MSTINFTFGAGFVGREVLLNFYISQMDCDLDGLICCPLYPLPKIYVQLLVFVLLS